MPNQARPPLRIYSPTPVDTQIIAQARETLARSIQILDESRAVTTLIGYWNRERPPPRIDPHDVLKLATAARQVDNTSTTGQGSSIGVSG